PANSFHQVFFGQSQSTDSIYAELQAPLVAAKDARTGIRSLDLQLAGRSERYTVNAGTPFAILAPDGSLSSGNPPQGVGTTIRYPSTNPTIGLKYKPIADLIFRTSYAKAFLPPTPSELLPNLTLDPGHPITDPRNGETYGVSATFGGNPNLRPQ